MTRTRPLQVVQRPAAMPGADAGAQKRGGWLAPDGRFYPCERFTHLRAAAELRATGNGPADPWTMADGWALVRVHGEVVSLPQLTQPQWDTLGDMLVAAPPGGYHTQLLQSIRQLVELESSRA